MRFCTLLMVITFQITPLFGQRFPDRWFTINPLMHQLEANENTGWTWMHSNAGWGEFGGYRIIRDHEHAWIQRLGGYIELFRISETTSLAFLGSIEFIANADNDIRFNPRAIFWEEGFLFTQKTGRRLDSLSGSYWQIGYMHRCKHDIDNLNLGRERSLMFGSLMGKYILPFALANTSTIGLLALRADLYTIRQDDRNPSVFSSYLPQVKSMLATLGGALHLRTSLPVRPLGLYATTWSALNFYGDKQEIFLTLDRVRSILFQGGIGGGIAVEGRAHLRLGISYEYLSDTGINPFPEHANLITISITMIPPISVW